MEDYRPTEAEFESLYNELCNECGINPANKAPQCRAWYRKFGKRPYEVLREACRFVGNNSRYIFPTVGEFSEAVRRAEVRARLSVEKEYDTTCRWCGGRGLVRLDSHDAGEVLCSQDDVARGGWPFFARCTCAAANSISKTIPLYSPGLVSEGLRPPVHGRSVAEMNKDEALTLLKEL